jgi:hypothetical protein
MTRPKECIRLRVENAALREALEEQWEAAHFDHCARLHGPEKACMWPRPEVLWVVPQAREDPHAAS